MTSSPLSLKTILLKSFGVGVGFALTLGLIGGVWLWNGNMPKPAQPWNTNAIRATYDHIDTNADDNHILFFYVLENATDRDYRVETKDGIELTAMLAKQASLAAFDDYEKIHYPIFIPSKQRLRFGIEIPYPYKGKKGPSAKDLEEYVRSEFKNLNGFALFDSNIRYQINFPKGW